MTGAAGSKDPALHDRAGLKTRPYSAGAAAGAHSQRREPHDLL